jgi:hypothetical protein
MTALLRFARVLPVATAALFAFVACSSPSASPGSRGDAAAGDGSPSSDDGGADAPADAGGDAMAPSSIGDPQGTGMDVVKVVINGMTRYFPMGGATWEQTPVDLDAGLVDGGPHRTGFFVQAMAANGWFIDVGAFDAIVGAHSCADTVTSDTNDARLSLVWMSGGMIVVSYGDYVGTATCAVTLQTYGTHQGDPVTGTFEGTLQLATGDPNVYPPQLTLTDGVFNATETTDVPP